MNRWIFLLTFFISTLCSAQSDLVVQVVDSGAGPLIGASVYLKDVKIGGATDISGIARLTNVPDGEHILIVRYTGFKTAELSVTTPFTGTFTVTLEQEVRRLSHVGAARIDSIVRPDRDIERRFFVSIEVADEQGKASVGIWIPALEGACDSLTGVTNGLERQLGA